MENKEITKTFPVAETFLASWRYCRENRRHIAVFTLVNWLLLLLGFKFMGGTGNILFIFWCVLYYLFSCFFFRFYYNRRPYLLTHKIFDSFAPSTKILFLTLALATLLAYLPFAPLFLGFPAEMMEDYAVGFIQEYMDENKLYDMGLALVLLLVSPIIFFRRRLAWIKRIYGCFVFFFFVCFIFFCSCLSRQPIWCRKPTCCPGPTPGWHGRCWRR